MTFLMLKKLPWEDKYPKEASNRNHNHINIGELLNWCPCYILPGHLSASYKAYTYSKRTISSK